MKQLVLGMVLGASLMGMFMNSKNVESMRQIESQQVEMNRMGNQIAQLKLSINELKMENAQLYEQTK